MSAQELRLGDRVSVSDYLVRAEMNGYQAVLFADAWDEFPNVIGEAARAGLKAYTQRTGQDPRSWSSTGNYKAWVPRSIFYDLLLKRVWLRLDSRRHPMPHPESLPLPVEGVVIRKLVVQDGRPDNDYEDGSNWVGMATRTGYQVAYHLARRPLFVLPSMIGDPS